MRPEYLTAFVADVRMLRERFYDLLVSGLALAHQVGHIDPQRIVLHLHRLVEGEGLRVQVEAQSGEGVGVAVEELGRPAARHAVERGHALLTVEQELDDAGCERCVAAMGGGHGLGGPHQQPTDRMAAVERVEQPPDLVAVPDIAALELRQRHVAVVDMIENRRNLHPSSSKKHRRHGCSRTSTSKSG
jgi:hypothetical protein